MGKQMMLLGKRVWVLKLSIGARIEKRALLLLEMQAKSIGSVTNPWPERYIENSSICGILDFPSLFSASRY